MLASFGDGGGKDDGAGDSASIPGVSGSGPKPLKPKPAGAPAGDDTKVKTGRPLSDAGPSAGDIPVPEAKPYTGDATLAGVTPAMAKAAGGSAHDDDDGPVPMAAPIPDTD